MGHTHRCEWKKKDLEKKMKQFTRIVGKPAYVCAKCTRVASAKKYLCKPIPLKAKGD